MQTIRGKMNNFKVLLVGLPGSGKTTLQNQVVKSAKNPLILGYDLDQVIEMTNPYGSKLSELIPSIGEESFRKLEKKTLFQLLERDENMVISLGGGTLSEEILAELTEREAVQLVYLESSIIEAVDLTIGDPDRPLSKLYSADELRELFEQRRQIFLGINYKIKTEMKLEQQVTEILKLFLRDV